jgi:hypothetical protein
MAHAWWHNCLTIGKDTGAKVPLKLTEGSRGNLAVLLRFPHDWTETQCVEASKKLDALALQMVEVVRQPQESIVFNPMQGTPTPLPD